MGDILPFDKINITKTNEDGEEVTHTIKLTEEDREFYRHAALCGALDGLQELFEEAVKGNILPFDRREWLTTVIHCCRTIVNLTEEEDQPENEE